MSIPGSASPLFFQAAAAAAADQVATRSVRFNADDSARLTRTFGSGGNRKTWTWSGWFKRHKSESMTNMLFACYVNSSNRFYIGIQGGSDKLLMFGRVGGSDSLEILSDQVFRDFGAWYHMVVAIDSTQGSSGNRVKVYVNGTQISLATTTALAQNGEPYLNAAVEHHLGFLNGSSKLNAYMADVYFVDGSQLDATSFGEFDSNGVWQAKAASGLTFGTNGYHLKFEDTSSNAAIGTDSSGNSNTFTVHNLYASTAAAVDYSTGQVTGSESGFVSGYGPDKMFDGSLSTLTDQVDTGNTGEAGYLYWNPSTAVSVSSKLRIYGRWYVSSIGNQYLISDEVSINGNSYVAPGDGTSSNQWVDLSSYLSSNSITSITNITFRSNPTSGNRLDPGIAAIEVDDTILVNSAATDGDVMFDAPTNGTQSDTGAGGEVSGNYCVLNSLAKGSNITLSNGNLEASTTTSSGYGTVLGTIGVSSGKWYWEFTGGSGALGVGVGIAEGGKNIETYLGEGVGYSYYSESGKKYSGAGGANYGASYGANDVIGVAFDADAGTLVFYKNGSSQGTAYTGLTNGPYFPAIADSSGTNSFDGVVNFGQRSFTHSAPSNHKCLCTTNLPTPTIANGSDYFEAKLWTGNSPGTQTISNFSMSPDFVWIKNRSASKHHSLLDIVRGGDKVLKSDSTAVEDTASNFITSFTSDGFAIGNDSAINGNGNSIVGWAWDAGSSTVSNTDGATTASVRANPTAGFSIVSWSGHGSGATTIGHGLNAAPELIILKGRDNAGAWVVGSDYIGWGDRLELNTSSAQGSASADFNSTAPTNSVFTVGSNQGTGNKIAYCFSPVAGFSSVGSFVNPSASDSAFVFCGFRPAFLLAKCAANISSSSGSGDWIIKDNKRSPFNDPSDGNTLVANVDNAEDNYYNANQAAVDFLSNGFKIRHNNTSPLGDPGRRYVFIAFAENPFQANGGLAR